MCFVINNCRKNEGLFHGKIPFPPNYQYLAFRQTSRGGFSSRWSRSLSFDTHVSQLLHCGPVIVGVLPQAVPISPSLSGKSWEGCDGVGIHQAFCLWLPSVSVFKESLCLLSWAFLGFGGSDQPGPLPSSFFPSGIYCVSTYYPEAPGMLSASVGPFTSIR